MLLALGALTTCGSAAGPMQSRRGLEHVLQVGELMDGRYEALASNGKGVFSSVVRARDISRKDESGQHPEVRHHGSLCSHVFRV